MRKSVRGCAAIALAVTGIAVAGCGETVIDDGKAEDAVKQNLQGSLPVKIVSVDCPSDQKVEPKATFDCQISTAKGTEAVATLKILNDDADVKIVALNEASDNSSSEKPEDGK